MSGCTCVARCSMTASYGRKFVETMARPFACAMAHFTISSAGWERSSALAWVIWSGVIGLICPGLLIQDGAIAPITKPFAAVPLFGKTREQRAQLGFDLWILDHIFEDAVEARAG